MNSSTGLPALTMHHDAARALELRDHFLDGMRADDLACPCASLARNSSTFDDGAVVGHDGEAVVVHVEDEVLAHDGQADECDVCFRFHLWDRD